MSDWLRVCLWGRCTYCGSPLVWKRDRWSAWLECRDRKEPDPMYRDRMRWYHWLLWPGFWLVMWVWDYLYSTHLHPNESWISRALHSWELKRIEKQYWRLMERKGGHGD